MKLRVHQFESADFWILLIGISIFFYLFRSSYLKKHLPWCGRRRRAPLTLIVSRQKQTAQTQLKESKEDVHPWLVSPERALFGAAHYGKRAVVGGINYFGTDSELQGCIADATNQAQRLYTVEGFRMIVFMIDSPDHKGLRPTGANIRKCMDWLVRETRPGDSLWFSFSSHGSRMITSSRNKGSNGGDDEENNSSCSKLLPRLCGLSFGPFGNNKEKTRVRTDVDQEYDDAKECMVPVDYDMDDPSTLIFDDELYGRLVTPLSHIKAKLTILLDCCHSGNGMGEQRYRYSYLSPNQCARQRGLQKSGLTKAVCTYEDPRFANEQVAARVVYIGACRDEETAEDVDDSAHHQHYGAASKAYLSAVAPYNRSVTYRQLFDGMYKWLDKNNITDQHPQFSSSQPLNLDAPFVL